MSAAPAPGRATAEATALYAAQQSTTDFYRPAWDGLTLASIGLGTYLGEPDQPTDERYGAALRRYLALGGNLIDTAINYRFQRSERSIGVALKAAAHAGEVTREAVVLCTKGGYLPFDGGWPSNPEAWIRQTFVDTGIITADDIVDGHCLAPAYLRHQIAQSLQNLQLATIDLYYLHNPEGQRAALGEVAFRARLREALAALEAAVSQGQIAAYGLATWNGFRVQPEAPDYLELNSVVDVARDVAGDGHHFRAVQLPLNLAMTEALTGQNQPAAKGLQAFLDAAAGLGVTAIASAPLLQARLLGRLSDPLRSRLERCETDAQRALQFVRSAPGLTAVLAGMSRIEHVEENLRLNAVPPLTAAAFGALFQAS